ncbi:2-phosphosulfolactate phosphatase [Paenibacillus polygoni]|uniref:Probable 2-phosphosulfolactate phosphatase n=1 Tax=Paenibacillus polygoni TaxID=3050112 RepID=A0ABY8WY31_9BACL|nr:2-phosphosulfolactate phosphatase [Paenibacillus polygoni]WIV18060.1 2-phosphosulfolactate phosphatase [Paenibacillus polygoni]
MRIDVVASASEIRTEDVIHRSAVVIDVFRTTSTIVTALAQGAICITPVETVPKAKQLGLEGMFLGGERFCKKIAGFDAGNSPLEYTKELVEGRKGIMTTTSGTRALIKAGKASYIFTAAFLNVKACAEVLAEVDLDIAILCAGQQDRLTMEDSLCAGMLIHYIKQSAVQPVRLNDLGLVVHQAYLGCEADLRNKLKESNEAKRLTKQGHEKDVDYCLTENAFTLVPVMEDHFLVPWKAKEKKII